MYKAKKSLGQNFLKSNKAINDMLLAGNINKNDTVLEIGPGKGILTKALLEKAGKVIAIEKDKDLILILNEVFKKEIKNGKLELVEGDVLELPLNHHPAFQAPLLKKEGKIQYKLIANIPYYITGAIFQKFLENEFQPETMVLLVQKEVAQRIACDKKESILSLSVKAYGIPKYISTVSKRYFSPSPKVDSAILAINNISRKNFKNKKQEVKFFTLIKNSFAHKRKQLAGNLREKGYENDWIEKIFEKFKLKKDIRAEDVHIDMWIDIANEL